MRIQNNIMAMNTHRSYSINNENVAKSAEKLSSGYRINRAGDDAAGLAISEKMRSQIRGLNMATKNSQDAISLVSTAEGALQETHNILQRMRELAVQSASDTNETSVDRDALNKEFQQLINEIDDTASKTKFNDMGLIDGSFSANTKSLDATTLPAGISVSVAGAQVGDWGVTAKFVDPVDATPTAAVAPTVDDPVKGATFTAIAALGDKLNGITSGSMAVSVNQDTLEATVTLNVNGKTYTSAPASMMGSKGAGATGDTVDFNFEGLGTLQLTLAGDVAGYGDAQNEANILSGKTLTFDAGITATSTAAQEAKIALTDNGGETVYVKAGDTHAKFSSGVVLSFQKLGVIADEGIFGTKEIEINVSQAQGKPLVIQTGANRFDELRINIDRMDSETLGVKFSSISTREDASKAINEVNTAVNAVSTQRASLGALSNRLDHKIANLKVTSENLTAAESRIRDVDIASEMTTYTKNNILSQAATAMLAQANSAPQNVLSLLR